MVESATQDLGISKLLEQPELSIVVPVYNEVPANLELLLQRLHAVFEPLLIFYEVIFVDDGSREATASVLRDFPKLHPLVRTVVLSRNFGEQAAICAGIGQARGNVIINMDSDLQDPPELLPTMLQYWREGCDVVYTQQVNRSDPFFRLLLTNTFYWLLNKVSPVSIPHAGEFRLLSRRAANALLSLPEQTVFLRHLVPWIGFKQAIVPFKRQQRDQGTSSYTLVRLLRLGMAGFISSTLLPLVLVPLFGLCLVLVAGLVCFTVPNIYLSTNAPLIWSILLWFAAVVNLLALTVLGSYLSVTLKEVRARPPYIIAEVIQNKSAQPHPDAKERTSGPRLDMEISQGLE